jgi:SAM-dependent methyltransferase
MGRAGCIGRQPETRLRVTGYNAGRACGRAMQPLGALDVPMQQNLAAIESIVACPTCRGALRFSADAVACTACSARFPIQDGIPMFARIGSPAEASAQQKAATSEKYQRAYQQDQRAAEYNAMYRDSWAKSLSTRREFRLLDRLLDSQGHCRTLLDLPCGGGRVSPPLARHTDLLIEADIGLGQVRYASQNGRVPTEQFWMTASGFEIPLQDAAVDGTVCVRLNHHLPTAVERERLVRELLRVSKRFVVMTFFDYASLKNRLRRLRGKPPKLTMRVDELRELARTCGAELVSCPALFVIGSGHRYALMVKQTK